jgi:hypothetical protein
MHVMQAWVGGSGSSSSSSLGGALRAFHSSSSSSGLGMRSSWQHTCWQQIPQGIAGRTAASISAATGQTVSARVGSSSSSSMGGARGWVRQVLSGWGARFQSTTASVGSTAAVAGETAAAAGGKAVAATAGKVGILAMDIRVAFSTSNLHRKTVRLANCHTNRTFVVGYNGSSFC